MDRRPRLGLALVWRTHRHREFPLDALRAIVEARKCLEQIERESVEIARERGATWDEITAVLGVSRQAVYQRYR